MNFARNLTAWVVLVGNLLMMSALSLHVVRTPAGFTAVAKDHLTLVDTYTDARAWGPSDCADHAALVARLTQAGKGEMLVPAVDTPAKAADKAADKVSIKPTAQAPAEDPVRAAPVEKTISVAPARPRTADVKPEPAPANGGGSKLFPIN